MARRRDRRQLLVLGLDDEARRRLLGRVLLAAQRTDPPLAELLPLEEELALRGWVAETEDAPAGRRTTRQALDGVLAGEPEPPADPETFYLRTVPDGPVLAWVDLPASRLRDDASHHDSLHPLREHAREAHALLVQIDAARWSQPDGPSATELDRMASVLRRCHAARSGAATRLAIAIVATGAEELEPERRAAPSRWPAIEQLCARLPTRRLELRIWTTDSPPLRRSDSGERPQGSDPFAPVARWLLERAAGPRRPLWVRWSLRVGLATTLLAAILFAAAALDLYGLRRRAPAPSIAQERGFIERSLARLQRWRKLPGTDPGGLLYRALGLAPAEAAVREHARHLEQLLLAHPAVAEPHAAVALSATRYRAAAHALALVQQVLDGADTPEAARLRAERIALLQHKARIAEMPRAGPDTLAAWRQLRARCPDPVLVREVITPRIEAVLTALSAQAVREAARTGRFPQLFEPLLRLERRHGPLGPERRRAVVERLWELAWQTLQKQLEATPEPQRAEALLAALASAPVPPPASVRQRMGAALGPWLHRAALEGHALEPLRTRIERTLGAAGARALLAALAPLYQNSIALDRNRGPAALAALRKVAKAVPQRWLEPKERERLEALIAHLGDMTRAARYGVRVERAWLSERYDSVFDSLDLVVEFHSERSGSRTLGPRHNRRDTGFDKPLWPEGSLIWRPWDRIEIRLRDDERDVGLRYLDEGSPFGLHQIDGTWTDPEGRGGFTLRISPHPPVWFDFTGWPSP
ncbi:MAG: hypothetical protein D6776_03740 [Planctomycetota bacterium]|nr:MAG: hypothetical protein D6776_03740 [Planctomycetota bacterium]